MSRVALRAREGGRWPAGHAMFAASGSPFVVREVQGLGSDAVIVLGGMGKIYLMYLVVVVVAVLWWTPGSFSTADQPLVPRARLSSYSGYF